MFKQDHRLCQGIIALLLSAGVGLVHAQGGPTTSGDDKSSDKKCAALPEEERRRTEACKTAEEKRADQYQRIVKEREEREKPRHSSFLDWLHLDALWIPATSGVSSYGLVGAHMTIADIHGANVFGPPGVMLILDNDGGRLRLRPALTWGASLHLLDFRTPGSGRDAQLYLNIAKCWTTGGYQGGIDMAGLSVTWKK